MVFLVMGFLNVVWLVYLSFMVGFCFFSFVDLTDHMAEVKKLGGGGISRDVSLLHV